MTILFLKMRGPPPKANRQVWPEMTSRMETTTASFRPTLSGERPHKASPSSRKIRGPDRLKKGGILYLSSSSSSSSSPLPALILTRLFGVSEYRFSSAQGKHSHHRQKQSGPTNSGQDGGDEAEVTMNPDERERMRYLIDVVS
jgi:hypothetical protein